MIQSPETLNDIAKWRAKVLDKTITLDEMKAAIIALRQGRRTAVTATKAKAAKAPARSAEDLLGELQGL